MMQKSHAESSVQYIGIDFLENLRASNIPILKQCSMEAKCGRKRNGKVKIFKNICYLICAEATPLPLKICADEMTSVIRNPGGSREKRTLCIFCRC